MNAGQKTAITIVGVLSCLFLGCVGVGLLGVLGLGMGDDVAEGFRSGFGEPSPDLANPKRVERAAFSVEFPGNWKVDTNDAGYDPDHVFTIDSAGSNYASFEVFDSAMSPKDLVDTGVRDFGIFMSEKSRAQFTTWGAYEGVGVHVEGSSLGDPGGMRAFSWSGDSRAFVVVEVYTKDNWAKNQKAFELIEQSFKIDE